GKLVSAEKPVRAPSVRRPGRRGVDWLLIVFGLITLVSILGLGTLGAAVWRGYTVTPTPVPTPSPFLSVPTLAGTDWSMGKVIVEAQNLMYEEGGREFSGTASLNSLPP